MSVDSCPRCGAPKSPPSSGYDYVCGYTRGRFDSRGYPDACEYAAGLRAERDRYRKALERIADPDVAGVDTDTWWYDIALEALEADNE